MNIYNFLSNYIFGNKNINYIDYGLEDKTECSIYFERKKSNGIYIDRNGSIKDRVCTIHKYNASETIKDIIFLYKTIDVNLLVLSIEDIRYNIDIINNDTDIFIDVILFIKDNNIIELLLGRYEVVCLINDKIIMINKKSYFYTVWIKNKLNYFQSNNKIKWIGNKQKYIDMTSINTMINECFHTNIFTNNGKYVQQLQIRLKEILNVNKDKELLLVCNGACGINAIVGGLNYFYGKKLRYLTQGFTYPCTHQGILSDSIIVDIDDTMGPNVDEIYDNINNIDCIIITNCFGYTTDIKKYVEICKQYNKMLIFDNASTPYTFYNGINSINYASCSMISFHHTKQLGFGEGGAIIYDAKYHDVMSKVINFGYTPINRQEYMLYASNYKMSELSAIYLLSHINNYQQIHEHIKSLCIYFKNRICEYGLDTIIDLFYGFEQFGLISCIPIISKHKHINMELFISYGIEAKKYYYPLDIKCKKSLFIYDNIILLPCNMDTTIETIQLYINILLCNKDTYNYNWGGDENLLYSLYRLKLSRYLKYNILEIGSFEGQGTTTMLKYFSHPETRITCVDPFNNEIFDDHNIQPIIVKYKLDKVNYYFNRFNNNTCQYNNKIIIKKGLSEEICPQLDKSYYDIIYIDGNHHPDSVYLDGCLCLTLLKNGGIIIFDDYGWPHQYEDNRRCKDGIDKFYEENKNKFNIIYKEYQLIIQSGGSAYPRTPTLNE